MGVSSAEKALRILLALSSKNQEKGNLELSDELGFSSSTVNRLLRVLESLGFARQNPDNKRYTLGSSAADLGRAVNRNISSQLVGIAQPYVDTLRDLTGETAGLELMSGMQAILIYESKGPNPVSVSFSVGDRLPVHVAAGAKAILAFSPPGIVDRFLNGKLTRLTPHSITNVNILKRQLEEARKEGIAFDYGELNVDVAALGAPVFDHEKRPIAAVVVAAPAFRMNKAFESKVIPILKDTAAHISSRLFYPFDQNR